MHLVFSHYAIKSNAAINILGHVFWAHGQDFLLGHSISYYHSLHILIFSTKIRFFGDLIFGYYPQRLCCTYWYYKCKQAACLFLPHFQFSGVSNHSIHVAHLTEISTAGLWCLVFHSLYQSPHLFLALKSLFTYSYLPIPHLFFWIPGSLCFPSKIFYLSS